MSEKNVTIREKNTIVQQEANSANAQILGDFNKVWVSGIIEEELEFSHEVFMEEFYKTKVRVTRLSGTEDLVPIIVSKLLISNIFDTVLKGKYVEIAGQFRSYNKIGEDSRKHLELFLFVKAINVYESEEELEIFNANMIYLEGYICKDTIFRTTPLGREITDLMIAVNRNYDKSDYIPCVAWGRYAQYADKLKVSDKVKLYGRIQSREYFKRYSPGSEKGEYKIAYEISIVKIMKIEDYRLEG